MDSKIWYIPARNDRLEKNVGIYCRVSTKEKEQLYSLAAQLSRGEQLRMLANGGWQMKGEVPRREFERLIKECEAHNISVVLTKSISRFGGDTVETLSALNRLKAVGVRLIFEQENLDTDEVDSNLMISVMESLSQAENESRSENIRLGLAMSRKALVHQDSTNESCMATLKIRMESLLLTMNRLRWCEIFSDGIWMVPVCLVL